MEFSSKLLSQAVEEIAQLPDWQTDSLAFGAALLKQPKNQTLALASALEAFRTEIIFVTSATTFRIFQPVPSAQIPIATMVNFASSKISAM